MVGEHMERNEETDFEPKILTLEESKRKKQLEAIIHKGWANCSKIIGEMAEALLEIKNKKLYKATHKNWATYCADVIEMSERGVRYALNRYEVGVIIRGLKGSESDVVDVTNENDDQNRQPFPILDRKLTAEEVKSVEPLEGAEKVAAVTAMAQSPTPLPVPPRTPRMPPPRAVVPAEAPTPVAAEPEVQKPVCPLDNDQLHWVVLEIENWYLLNKAAVNSVPPPTPMALVSKIQRHLQNLKKG